MLREILKHETSLAIRIVIMKKLKNKKNQPAPRKYRTVYRTTQISDPQQRAPVSKKYIRSEQVTLSCSICGKFSVYLKKHKLSKHIEITTNVYEKYRSMELHSP